MPRRRKYRDPDDVRAENLAKFRKNRERELWPSMAKTDEEHLKLFDELNEIHFAGELRRVPVVINRYMKSYGGYFYPQLFVWKDGRGHSRVRRNRVTHIVIAGRYQDSPRQFRSTMLHEMIHYWLWFRRGRKGRSMQTDLSIPEERYGGHRSNFMAKMKLCQEIERGLDEKADNLRYAT